MTHRYLALLVILAALSMPVHGADIVFSNLGPDNQYQVVGTLIGGPTNMTVPAVAFTPSDNFTLTHIDVALIAAPASSAMLSLASSSGGLPGGTIESWTLTGLPSFLDPPFIRPEQTVTPDMPVPLVSGTQYWLVVSPVTQFTAGWNFSLSDTTSPFANSLNGGSFVLQDPGTPRPAFAVLGNPVGNEVPEPTSLVLLVIGMVGMVGMALRLQVRP